VSSLSTDTVLVARFVVFRIVDSSGVLVVDTDLTPVGKVLVTVEPPFTVDEAEKERVVFCFFLLVATADAEFVVIVGNFVGAITIVRPTIKILSCVMLS
jgi:hypothetical protein